MDCLTFISTLIQAIVWPGVVLTIFLLFRPQWTNLLKRLTKFEGPGIKGEFSEGLQEAERQAEKLKPDLLTPGAEPLDEQMDFLVKIAPAAAVLSAWRNVERELRAAEMAIPGTGSAYPLDLPEELKPLYRKLRHLRNSAAHEKGEEITSLQAEDYTRLAREFIARLREIPPQA